MNTRTPAPLPKLTGELQDSLRELRDFLLGTGPLQGCHFGERPADAKGNFWWRGAVRRIDAAIAALAAMPAPPSPADDVCPECDPPGSGKECRGGACGLCEGTGKRPVKPSPDHAELVEQLRVENGRNGGQGAYAWRARELCGKAADLIEALSIPPDARAKVIEEGPADLFSRLLRWRDAEAAAAEARGEPMFMGKPDAWYEDTHWFCANGHVSARFLKSERGDLCLACQAPAFLGPKIGETAFALIRTRLRALSPSGQSGGGE